MDGLSATTARTAKAAGVSEGSLFNYFTTKDELQNQLYLSIKRDLVEFILNGCEKHNPAADRIHRMWLNYLKWCIDYPHKRTAMVQLSVSGRVNAESRKTVLKDLAPVRRLLRECFGKEFVHSAFFASTFMEALALATVNFMLSDPKKSESYAETGFRAFWTALVGGNAEFPATLSKFKTSAKRKPVSSSQAVV